MSLKFIRLQKSDSLIRLRSNSKRTRFFANMNRTRTLRCLSSSSWLRDAIARHQRVHRHSPTAVNLPCPSRLSVPSCSRPYKTKPSAALNRGPVLTVAARDGARIQRPGREDGSAGAELENDGEEESARRHAPSCYA